MSDAALTDPSAADALMDEDAYKAAVGEIIGFVFWARIFWSSHRCRLLNFGLCPP